MDYIGSQYSSFRSNHCIDLSILVQKNRKYVFFEPKTFSTWILSSFSSTDWKSSKLLIFHISCRSIVERNLRCEMVNPKRTKEEPLTTFIVDEHSWVYRHSIVIFSPIIHLWYSGSKIYSMINWKTWDETSAIVFDRNSTKNNEPSS